MNKKHLLFSGKLFNGKKGYSILLTIFELLVVIAIIVMVNAKASSYAKSDPIVQKNIANDLALMIDALAGFPGNVLVEYPKDVSKYSFLISLNRATGLNKIVVFRTGESAAGGRESVINRRESAFALPANYDAGGDMEGQARLCIRKTAGRIFLEACP